MRTPAGKERYVYRNSRNQFVRVSSPGEPVSPKSQEVYQFGPYTPIMGPSGRKLLFRPSTGE
jgi:hypothetical protein